MIFNFSTRNVNFCINFFLLYKTLFKSQKTLFIALLMLFAIKLSNELLRRYRVFFSTRNQPGPGLAVIPELRLGFQSRLLPQLIPDFS